MTVGQGKLVRSDDGGWAMAAGVLHVITYLGPALIAIATGMAAFMQFETQPPKDVSPKDVSPKEQPSIFLVADRMFFCGGCNACGDSATKNVGVSIGPTMCTPPLNCGQVA